jgi:hypothetical protein
MCTASYMAKRSKSIAVAIADAVDLAEVAASVLASRRDQITVVENLSRRWGPRPGPGHRHRHHPGPRHHPNPTGGLTITVRFR